MSESFAGKFVATGFSLIATEFIKAFCMKENASDLLNMKKEGLEVFYGIKYLTMCLITLDHQIGISNSGPISNGYTSDQVITN